MLVEVKLYDSETLETFTSLSFLVCKMREVLSHRTLFIYSFVCLFEAGSLCTVQAVLELIL